MQPSSQVRPTHRGHGITDNTSNANTNEGSSIDDVGGIDYRNAQYCDVTDVTKIFIVRLATQFLAPPQGGCPLYVS